MRKFSEVFVGGFCLDRAEVWKMESVCGNFAIVFNSVGNKTWRKVGFNLMRVVAKSFCLSQLISITTFFFAGEFFLTFNSWTNARKYSLKFATQCKTVLTLLATDMITNCETMASGGTGRKPKLLTTLSFRTAQLPN